MTSPLSDASTVIDEPGWGGGGVCIDSSGDGMHLPPKERRAFKKRRRAWYEKLRRAEEIRTTWGPEDFAAEEARIAAQIEEWERSRDAA